MSKIIATLLIAFGLLIAGNSEKENAESAPMLLVTIAPATVQPCAFMLVTADSAAQDQHTGKAEKEKPKKKFGAFRTKHKHKSHAPHHHHHAPHHYHHHVPKKISAPLGPLFLTGPPTCG